jgi:ferredoxin
MGAFFSCTSRINLFGVRIDKTLCKECNRCIDSCPVFALDKNSLAAGKPSISCSKCGACFESCPEKAIAYSTLGVPFAAGPRQEMHDAARAGFWRTLAKDLWDPGVVFIFGIFVLSTVMASNYLVDATSRLLRYFLGI